METQEINHEQMEKEYLKEVYGEKVGQNIMPFAVLAFLVTAVILLQLIFVGPSMPYLIITSVMLELMLTALLIHYINLINLRTIWMSRRIFASDYLKEKNVSG